MSLPKLRQRAHSAKQGAGRSGSRWRAEARRRAADEEPSVARPVRLMARHGASNAFKAEAAGEQARIWHHLFKALARVGNELFLQVSDCKVRAGFP